MDFLDLILGVTCISFGAMLINYYQNLKRSNKHGALSFKLQLGGLGLIIIGVGLIVRSFKN